MLHLNRLSEKVPDTGMTAKNLSIVWAPNLLRTPLSMHTGCDNGFGGVSIKLNGEADCRNGKVSAPKPSNNNKTIIHQDARGNGSYNCTGNVFANVYLRKALNNEICWLLSCHNNYHFYSLAAAEQHSKLQFNLIQNTHVIQCLIENARWLFNVEEKTGDMNGFPSLVMPPFPSTASNSNVAKKSFSGSNGQILQMQPKYEEREIKFKTAAIPSSVSTSQINKQPQPTFLERVRYIQPASKQIPLSKR